MCILVFFVLAVVRQGTSESSAMSVQAIFPGDSDVSLKP